MEKLMCVAFLFGCASGTSGFSRMESRLAPAQSSTPGWGTSERAFIQCFEGCLRETQDLPGTVGYERQVVVLTFACLFGPPANGATVGAMTAFVMRYDPTAMDGDFRLLMIRQMARRWGVDFEADARTVIFPAAALRPIYQGLDGVIFVREGNRVIMRFFRLSQPAPEPEFFNPPTPRPIRFGRGVISVL